MTDRNSKPAVAGSNSGKQAENDGGNDKWSSSDEGRQLTRLDWRLDPERSFSDWTVEVYAEEEEGGSNEGGTCRKRFHVHKNVLAFGPRQFKYFSTLFGGKNFAESKERVSTLRLPELLVGVCERAFDYVYGVVDNSALQIDTESATPLFCLADRLDSPSLRAAALKFIKEDLETYNKNGDIYYKHSTTLNSGEIRELILQYCAMYMDLHNFDLFGDIIGEFTDFDFWLDALDRCLTQLGDRHISGAEQWVAEICQRQEAILSPEVFYKLTSQKYFPKLSVCGLPLLKMEEKLVGPTDPNSLTDLQKRIIEGLSSRWDYMIADPDEGGVRHREVREAYEYAMQRPCMAAELTTAALKKAGAELKESKAGLKEARERASELFVEVRRLKRRREIDSSDADDDSG